MQSISSADAEAFTPFSIPESNEALVEMADLAMSSVSSGGRPACCADRYQVVVHIAAAPYKMDYGIAVEGMMRMAGTLQAARPFQSETWVDAIPAGCC